MQRLLRLQGNQWARKLVITYKVNQNNVDGDLELYSRFICVISLGGNLIFEATKKDSPSSNEIALSQYNNGLPIA
jgi:hypothetical protein